MFVLIKKCFCTKLTFFYCIILSVNPLECVSMNNQECSVRPEIINVDSNETSFYPYIIKVNKYNGSCNNINDPYTKLCVSDVVKKQKCQSI